MHFSHHGEGDRAAIGASVLTNDCFKVIIPRICRKLVCIQDTVNSTRREQGMEEVMWHTTDPQGALEKLGSDAAKGLATEEAIVCQDWGAD